MTEVYHKFINYLAGLSTLSTGEQKLHIGCRRGNGKPILESTLITKGGLSLADLELGLSGMAQLALYKEADQTGFSLVNEKADSFHRAVDFIHDGFSRPKLRNLGLVQDALGGPENVVARVVTDHISYLLNDADAAKLLVKVNKKSVIVADRYELELHPGRDIHGELRFKK